MDATTNTYDNTIYAGSFAKRIGAEEDLTNLFKKWDKIISEIPLNKINERADAAKFAILEVQSLLGIESKEGIMINDKLVK